MKWLVLPLLLTGLLSLPSCRESSEEKASQPDSSGEAREQILKAGKEAVQELAAGLGSRLKKAMADGGPVEAVKVCQLEAGPITDSLNGKRKGITVSRTSLKYRNPKNAPDDMDRKILESWQQDLADGKTIPEAKVVLEEEGPARFYKPIMLQGLCLNCHGPEEALLPELKTVLDELYPEDKARGFKVGDLRGAFRVEIER